MKPRIWKDGGKWRCGCWPIVGKADSFQKAYKIWSCYVNKYTIRLNSFDNKDNFLVAEKVKGLYIFMQQGDNFTSILLTEEQAIELILFYSRPLPPALRWAFQKAYWVWDRFVRPWQKK